MNKIILFSIVFALFINSLEAQILPVKTVTQEQNQWCWVGSSKCILDYYNYPFQQCEIAEYTRSIATWHDFGQVNCCTNPSGACNYWNYGWGYDGSIQDILVHFGNIENTGKGLALSLTEIQTEIKNFRPFVIRWGWTKGGGHFIIGHGIQNETLYYMNPWYGEGLKFATYDWVKSNTDHTWTHTNVLSTNPTALSILSVSTNTLSIAAPSKSTKTINISSNINWSAISNQDWLTLSSTSGSNNATITLTAQENTKTATRSALVTVSGTGVNTQTITVTQEAAAIIPFLTVSTNSLSIANTANSTIAFDIISNISWSVVSNQTWLNSNYKIGSNNATVTLIAKADTTTTSRNAIVTVSGKGVSSKTITVTQEARITEITNSEVSKIYIFPNPATTLLYVEGVTGSSNISVYDINGKLVINSQVDNGRIDVSNLRIGFYSLRIEVDDVIHTMKFEKK